MHKAPVKVGIMKFCLNLVTCDVVTQETMVVANQHRFKNGVMSKKVCEVSYQSVGSSFTQSLEIC